MLRGVPRDIAEREDIPVIYLSGTVVTGVVTAPVLVYVEWDWPMAGCGGE